MTPEPASGSVSARILGVGIATLDLINTVASYPVEDAEVRALSQRRARGGNAANTLEVLAQLGHRCRWTGTLGADAAADFIRADLALRQIDIRHRVSVPCGVTPTSYITLSRATGSRTIVHYRDLPELTAADFARLPLGDLDWIHFEGRNPAETARMLARVRREAPGIGVSVELEKDRPGIEALLDGPDVLLVSRAFVLARFGPPARPVEALADLAAGTAARLLVLGWGAEGAWLWERGGEPRQVPSAPPTRVVDTLGAGDALNAGVIDGLVRDLPAWEAVSRAVRLAGIKCGHVGLSGLVDTARAQGFR
ncbi:MAG: PfkB family carbohydrate kinase [Bdellovibrio bacteriovorus]